MKLSPPASSSDLDAAREIARRLHQRRRREDRPRGGARGPGEEELASLVPPPLPPSAAPAQSPLRSVPRAEPPPRPAALVEPPRPVPPEPPRPMAQQPPRPVAPEPPEPLSPPSWDEPGGPDAPGLDELDALAGIGEPAAPPEPAAPVGVPELAADEPPVSPEEMVGMTEPPGLEDLTGGEPIPPSPFDVDLDEGPVEDMVEVAAGPSWDDVVVACLDLSKAGGAMLIDPAGQVFAARGEWPDPGPDAIATKLVSTLTRTLKDSPTRSISAPLMGKQLTAWRVPLAEGLVTAAFIGDSPVRAEARPAIDAEIHRGPGA